MIELVDKDVKIAIMNILQMFKKAEESTCIKDKRTDLKSQIEKASRNEKYNI